MDWVGLADWWLEELARDETYEAVVTPLLLDVLAPGSGRYVDLGCGNGRVMDRLRGGSRDVIGIDIAEGLARLAPRAVVADLRSCPFANDSFDCGYSVLVVEHLPELESFFEEAARVVRPGGKLAVVSNHPIWTAPRSTPITDSDGEVMWRAGAYFDTGAFTDIEVGEDTVTFHHRSLDRLLSVAADAGWCLELMVERPHHEGLMPLGVPRLLACRWTLLN